ncbi:MAG: cytochrome P450 [Gammaproteobacteria bacterium]
MSELVYHRRSHGRQFDSVGDDAGALLSAALNCDTRRDDPYRFLGQLHGHGDFLEGSFGNFVWGYEAIDALLRSRTMYKGGSHGSLAFSALTPEQMERIRAESPVLPGFINQIDPPEHTRLRNLIAAAYTPRRVEQLRAFAQEFMDRWCDAADGGSPVEVVKPLAEALPAEVIGHLIGVPVADRADFAAWAQTQALDLDPHAGFDEKLRAARTRVLIRDYVRKLAAERERDPRDDLLSALLAEYRRHGTLTEPEFLSVLMIMYLAGFQTTMHMLTNGIVALCEHPGEYGKLHAEPDLARAATDEILRFDAPVMTIGYRAGADTAIGGRPARTGEYYTLLLGAANRDPRIFPDPARFDITRVNPKPSLSFGAGLHYCLGASLARLEGEVVFSTLARRFAALALAEPPLRTEGFRMRGFERIVVSLRQP